MEFLNADLVPRASDIIGELGLGVVNFDPIVEHKFKSTSRGCQPGQRKMIRADLEEPPVCLEE